MSKLNFDDLMNLKVGDKLFEYEYGFEIESTVTEPPFTEQGGVYGKVKCWSDNHGEIIYGINKKYQHYAPNVYNYKAYKSSI